MEPTTDKPAPVNSGRSEVAISLGGKQYTLRATLDCLKRIEAATGKGVVKIVARFQDADYSVSDVAAVIAAGINANPDNGARLSHDEVGVAIVEEGLINFLVPVSRFLGTAITSGPKKGN